MVEAAAIQAPTLRRVLATSNRFRAPQWATAHASIAPHSLVLSQTVAVALVLFLPTVCLSQLPSFRCDSNMTALEDCTFLTQVEAAREPTFASTRGAFDLMQLPAENFEATTDNGTASAETAIAPECTEHFHWRRALTESFTFLVIEQAYVVHTDFNWVVSENGIPFNHYWRDYMQSLSSWNNAGWSAGENPLYNYVGHPIQGAMTSYIEIQNDPKSVNLEYSKYKSILVEPDQSLNMEYGLQHTMEHGTAQ